MLPEALIVLQRNNQPTTTCHVVIPYASTPVKDCLASPTTPPSMPYEGRCARRGVTSTPLFQTHSVWS
ncbi:hypothetical protein HanRHA438_Chr04g0155551 [Helianthus annuus]|nr:hypothetical protein HanRHA438_Chr04g0155551 [Helianthus annuus]